MLCKSSNKSFSSIAFPIWVKEGIIPVSEINSYTAALYLSILIYLFYTHWCNYFLKKSSLNNIQDAVIQYIEVTKKTNSYIKYSKKII